MFAFFNNNKKARDGADRGRAKPERERERENLWASCLCMGESEMSFSKAVHARTDNLREFGNVVHSLLQFFSYWSLFFWVVEARHDYSNLQDRFSQYCLFLSHKIMVHVCMSTPKRRILLEQKMSVETEKIDTYSPSRSYRQFGPPLYVELETARGVTSLVTG